MIRTTHPRLRGSAMTPYHSRSSSAPITRLAPCIRTLSPAERVLKAELKTAGQLLSFNCDTQSLDVVGYPCYDDGEVVPPDALERFSRERCWPDGMRCFCDLVHGMHHSRPPRVFVPRTGVHAGSPCLGCRSYGRDGGHCSYFVNINDVLQSADIWTESLVLEVFPRRQHNGLIEGLPMTPTRTGRGAPGSAALVGVGLPSTGSLSPLTPLSSAWSSPSSIHFAVATGAPAEAGPSNESAAALWHSTTSRRELLPSEDDVTSTILGLLDESALGVSPADLTRVMGKCRLCNRCMGRNVLLKHDCTGRVESSDDIELGYLLATSYEGRSLSPIAGGSNNRLASPSQLEASQKVLSTCSSMTSTLKLRRRLVKARLPPSPRSQTTMSSVSHRLTQATQRLPLT
ncbi:uncharacterized protein B0H18DRAFT_523381 [Fomitopsis serialis]|uniref:uncharacterized protein n=1 Tax=Fomitopsis serialis TaxID=139415 RepID=UPI002007EEDD|nr:uncharacterized protein B0H18DRAFT_523381 [Neoantrodia serialis]KAH9922235.1 hypothetical protein B0H18DRAFT_523381 [Neoantrodia serialis]